MISSTIVHLSGSVSQHLVGHSHIHYAVQCLEPTLFDLCTRLVECIRSQLTECNMGRHQILAMETSCTCSFLSGSHAYTPGSSYHLLTKETHGWKGGWTSYTDFIVRPPSTLMRTFSASGLNRIFVSITIPTVALTFVMTMIYCYRQVLGGVR